RARIERVERPVVGADVDRRADAVLVGAGARRVDVVAGALAPGELPVARGERVDAAVRAADVDAAEGDRRGCVEAAAAEPEGAAAGAGRPDLASARGADRLD